MILSTSWKTELKMLLDECCSSERLSSLLILRYCSLGAGVIFQKEVVFCFTKCCMFLSLVFSLFIILFSELKSVWYSVRHNHVLNLQLLLFCPERSEPGRWHWRGFSVQTQSNVQEKLRVWHDKSKAKVPQN